MRISRKAVTVFAGLLVLGLSGAGVYIGMQPDDAEVEEADRELPDVSASESFDDDLPVPVEAAAVIQDTLVMAVNVPGEAASLQQTVVRSQVAGQVRSIRVRENSAVGGGAVLIEIDPTEYELRLEEARANLRRAEAQYREITLWDDQLPDARLRAQRDSAARSRANMDGAEVAVKRAELDLARTRVVAPFGGRVANIVIVPGQHVNAGDELVTILSMDPIRVQAQVLESEINFLTPGRPARVTFAAFPDRVFEGVIESINPLVDQQSRRARVNVRVSNPDGRILPGMYARLHLAAQRFPDRILVPRSAVLERDVDRRQMLFVVEDGFAKWRYVTTGMRNDEFVEIVPGDETEMVAPGELVLTSGHSTLIHDARIRVVENAAKEDGRRALQ